MSMLDNPERGYSLGELARLSFTSKAGPITGHGFPILHAFRAGVQRAGGGNQGGQGDGQRSSSYGFVQAQDVGVAINPMAVEGQIEGGAVQGIGRALSEAVVIQDGHIVNPSLTTYLMPLAPDIPAIENVLVEVPTDDGPFGAERWRNHPASVRRRPSPMPLRTRSACASKSFL